MTLRESPPGAELRVTGARLPPAAAFRLNELGIRLGTLAHMSQPARNFRSTDGATTWPLTG